MYFGSGGPGERDYFGYGAQTGSSFDGGYAAGEIAMAVVRIHSGDTAFELDWNWYISPEEVPTSEPVDWQKSDIDAPSASYTPDPISWVRFEHGNINDGTTLDELRIGTTYNDVVVPEPASLSLIGMGGLFLIRRRK